MPTITDIPKLAAKHNLEETSLGKVTPQPFGLLLVTTHPESAEEGAGDVVRVTAEFCDRSVLIDLTEVTRIDSWGLALFIEAMQRITALGGRLAIFGIRESVLRVLEAAKLDQVFDICSTREEALADHCRRLQSLRTEGSLPGKRDASRMLSAL